MGIFYTTPQPNQLVPYKIPSAPTPLAVWESLPDLAEFLAEQWPQPIWNVQEGPPTPPTILASQPKNPPTNQPNQFPVTQWPPLLWNGQVQSPMTSLSRVLEPIPPQPLNPPTRQPDQEAVGIWVQPTWNAQSAPLNTYPILFTTISIAPNQAPIGQWSQTSWLSQSLPRAPTPPPSILPWSPQPLEYSLYSIWPQPTWNTQRLTNTTAQTITVVSSSFISPDYSPWYPLTWNAQSIGYAPIGIIPPIPWNPEAVDYGTISTWPQPIWDTQRLPNLNLGSFVQEILSPFIAPDYSYWFPLTWNAQTPYSQFIGNSVWSLPNPTNPPGSPIVPEFGNFFPDYIPQQLIARIIPANTILPWIAEANFGNIETQTWNPLIWDAQKAKPLTWVGPILGLPEAPNQFPIEQWLQPIWGSQKLPSLPIPPPPFVPPNLTALNSTLANYILPQWNTEKLPTILVWSQPNLPIHRAPNQSPIAIWQPVLWNAESLGPFAIQPGVTPPKIIFRGAGPILAIFTAERLTGTLQAEKLVGLFLAGKIVGTFH